MADEKIKLSQKEVKTFNELKGIGGVHFPVFKDNTNYYKLPLSEIEKPLGETIDITDDFELINGMSTNDVGNGGRLKVIYVPFTDMVQIVGNFFSPSSKPYDSWVECMKYTGDLLSFNSVAGSQMNVGLGAPPDYISVRAIMTSAFIPRPNYSDRIFAFKGLIGNNNVPCYGVSAFLTCYGCRAAKLAEIAAAELANSGE